jgi:hypothetical protein
MVQGSIDDGKVNKTETRSCLATSEACKLSEETRTDTSRAYVM